MKKLKNGCHFININCMEKISNYQPSQKFGSPVFRVSMETDYLSRPLWKNWKMAAISLISIIWKIFKFSPVFQVSTEMEYHWKTGDANFFFSRFSIGLFFPITHPRLHFNIYAWLHLKHLCVDIYAWLTCHLCVVLHFLIFVFIVN